MPSTGKIIAALAGTMFTATAMAADLPAPVYKAPAYKAPVEAPWNWSGNYFGGNVGYGWGRWSSTSVANIFGDGSGATNIADPDVNGWLGGIQFGHNWQNGTWLYGLEADIQFSGAKGGNDSPSAFVSSAVLGGGVLTNTRNFSNEWAFPWFATFRGRLGVTINEWLLYGTGGLAVGHVKFTSTQLDTASFVGVPANVTIVTPTESSEAATRFGFALGAGVERRLAGNWTLKAEYLYLDLGSHTFLSGTGFDTTVDLRNHIARLGINYKFWDGR